jgi:prophage regulatory protein
MNIQEENKRLLTIEGVQQKVPLSRTTIWRLEQAGDFPQRISISKGRVGWDESEIESWITARLSKRGNQP